MDINKLSDILHCCGLDAFTRPSSQSAEEWKNYRDKIAGALLYKHDVQVKPPERIVDAGACKCDHNAVGYFNRLGGRVCRGCNKIRTP